MGVFDSESTADSRLAGTGIGLDENISNVDARKIDGEDNLTQGNINITFSNPEASSNRNRADGGSTSNAGAVISRNNLVGSDLSEGGDFSGDFTNDFPRINVTQTDLGALKLSGDIAADATEAVSAVVGKASEIATDAIETAKNATRDNQSRTAQFLIIGAVVVAGIYFLSNKS